MVTMSEERVYTEDEERMFCAWSDYRSEYGAYGIEAHMDFEGGWETARDGHTILNWNQYSEDWKAGFRAYVGDLDIGGVMR